MGHKVTSEFKQEAVRIALTSGLTRKQVASDFKIAFSTLIRWVMLPFLVDINRRKRQWHNTQSCTN